MVLSINLQKILLNDKSSLKIQFSTQKSNQKDLRTLSLHPQCYRISTYFPQSKPFKMRQSKHIQTIFNFDDKDETQRIDWFFQIGIEQMSQGCNFWFSTTWKKKIKKKYRQKNFSLKIIAANRDWTEGEKIWQTTAFYCQIIENYISTHFR